MVVDLAYTVFSTLIMEILGHILKLEKVEG